MRSNAERERPLTADQGPRTKTKDRSMTYLPLEDGGVKAVEHSAKKGHQVTQNSVSHPPLLLVLQSDQHHPSEAQAQAQQLASRDLFDARQPGEEQSEHS